MTEPLGTRAAFNKALSLINAGNAGEALTVCEAAVERDPEDVTMLALMIEGRPHQLEPGQAYEINNQKMHSVANRGDEDRITFIFDYVPAEQLGRVAA